MKYREWFEFKNNVNGVHNTPLNELYTICQVCSKHKNRTFVTYISESLLHIYEQKDDMTMKLLFTKGYSKETHNSILSFVYNTLNALKTNISYNPFKSYDCS